MVNKTPEYQLKASKKWYDKNKKKYKVISFKLDIEQDAELIELLDSQKNKTEFIKNKLKKS